MSKARLRRCDIKAYMSATGFLVVYALVGNQLEKHRYLGFTLGEAIDDFYHRFAH